MRLRAHLSKRLTVDMAVGLIAVSALFTVIGCEGSNRASTDQNPAGANQAATSSEYLLEEKPATMVSLSEAATELQAETKTGTKTMTLVGRIDAGEFPAFEADSATFMLSELLADGHGADDPDHEDNCPFCKRRAANAPKAIVQIVDGEGELIPTSARELLGLKEGDRIIATGDASFNESVNAITVKCRQVYTGP